MSFAPDIESHALVQEDRDDWAKMASDLFMVAAKQSAQLARLEEQLDGALAHAEYWESTADKALTALRNTTVPNDRRQGNFTSGLLSNRRVAGRRFYDAQYVPADGVGQWTPTLELVAPSRYSDGS